MTDITAILTAHDEGALAAISLHSMLDAIRYAEKQGIRSELIIVLDRPDAATRHLFSEASEEHGARIYEVQKGDQGLARNHAISMANGAFIALNDADDLWSENWLAKAWEICNEDPERTIAHPEVNWFFQENDNLFFHIDQRDPAFDPAMLRFVNCWDALCMASRHIFDDIPYHGRELARGFAFEDWRWNCETVEKGYIHRVVPATIHFKRRRLSSQHTRAKAASSLVPRTALFRYDWKPEIRAEQRYSK